MIRATGRGVLPRPGPHRGPGGVGGPIGGGPASDPVVFPEQHTRAATGAGRRARHDGAARPAVAP